MIQECLALSQMVLLWQPSLNQWPPHATAHQLQHHMAGLAGAAVLRQFLSKRWLVKK